MAKNPKWWVDTEAEEAEEPKTAAPKSEFDPASLDGQPVDGEALNHEKLDAIIAHRQLDTTDLASDATKAQKAEFINTKTEGLI